MGTRSVLLSATVFALTALSIACSGGGGPSGNAGTTTGNGGATGSAGGSGSNGGSGTSGAGAAGSPGSGSNEGSGTGSGGSGNSIVDAGSGANSGEADGASVAYAGDDGFKTSDGTDGAASNAWTGTWTAAPDGTCGAAGGQTVRSIVHTSIGGNAARVRISNALGNGPLHISEVHLAQRTTGSSIDPATDTALTFAGQPDVTVEAGMFALSDGANFVVEPISDVAISFFVMSSSGGTCQQNAFQTNYMAAGNMVSSPALNGGQNQNYLYVLGLDVQNPAAEGAVVALGASITTGFRAPADTNQRWPNLLADRLAAANQAIGVLNEGISGDITSGALGRFDRDVLSQTGVKWVIFSDNPINDLGGRSTPANDINQIKMMMSMAHAKGVKFLCSTLTPYTPDEPARTTVINFIKSADSGCDGIVDQDTATHDPAAPTMWAPQFNSGDGLHPNAAGMQAIADCVDLTLFK
jgi:lysophospholipase L1-like esterase